MYKIIGIDGQQYGPATRDLVRQWIAENRVSAQSLAQLEGTQEWKAVGTLPEFADAFASKAPISPAPPPFSTPPPKANPEAIAAAILARDYQLNIGDCISRSWGLLTRNFWLLVGASFVLGLIQGAIPLLAGVCMGGMYWLLLKLIRGERAEFGDAFSGFSLALLQLFLATLVTGILTSLGFLLCIIPGIYLAVAWIFTLPLIIDKRLDFWPAMELSRKIVTRHWWAMLGLVLVNFLVMIGGFLVCCIGVYIALPVVYGALAYAYDDIFRDQSAPAQPTPMT